LAFGKMRECGNAGVIVGIMRDINAGGEVGKWS